MESPIIEIGSKWVLLDAKYNQIWEVADIKNETIFLFHSNLRTQIPLKGYENYITPYVFLDYMNKPPLGLVPKFVRNRERLEEINEAIKRYVDVDKEIPEEWLKERNELLLETNK